MYSERELNDINQVFVRVSRDSSLPLQHGLHLRDRMWDRLKKGVVPKGYRYDWLLSTAHNIIRIVGEEADQFDQAHPGDCCSVEDLKDVVRYALSLLEKKSDGDS